MEYHSNVWIHNKSTFVISDNEEDHNETLDALRNQGGQVLGTYCSENDLGQVIVNRREV